MPLPNHALTVNGGCNCGAIRYRVEIPDYDNRPINTYKKASKPGDECRFPMVAIDHCNDCRRATGHLLPFWLVTPITMVSASFALRPASEFTRGRLVSKKVDEDVGRTPWLPAAELYSKDSKHDTYLHFYESSPNRVRSFCSRCGTQMSYAIPEMPEGWPDMLDIVLGTVDREDLEKDGLAPERELWWAKGIPWVQRLSGGGSGGIPRHPLSNINVEVE